MFQGYFHHADYHCNLEHVHCLNCGDLMSERKLANDHHCRLVCGTCGFIFYQNPKVVVGTIPIRDDKVVLVRRAIEPRKGSWGYPGGFMELGESTEEGAVRETKEETNLDVRISGLLNVYSRPAAGIVAIASLAEVPGGEPAICEETAEIKFFTSEEIPWDQLAFPTTEWALRDWQRRCNPVVAPSY